MPQHELDRAAAIIRRATSLVVLTGAGISAESGVPTFRGAGGLWKTFRPEDLASPPAFARDPATVWEWYRWRRRKIAGARPNPGHAALVRMEARCAHFDLVTQNVDGLHRRAGSRRLIELHGNIWLSRCARHCGFVLDESPVGEANPQREADDELDAPAPLPTCPCGSLLRPGVVWFGESLDPDVLGAAVRAAEGAQVCLVVGTSSLVHPAAALPDVAAAAGATIVEINVEDTPLTARAGVVLRGSAGTVLPEIESRL